MGFMKELNNIYKGEENPVQEKETEAKKAETELAEANSGVWEKPNIKKATDSIDQVLNNWEKGK